MDNPPADLQTVLRIMNEWRPMHTEDDVVKVPGNPPLLDLGLSLPHDINAYPFSRYAAKYIRDHRLGLTEDPIRFPFLPKFTALDNRDSVELFRLIMSFMFDGDPREERRLMLANYVVQKGLSSDQLRDEIYVQLVNQTLGQRSRSPQSPVAVWTLMASCLSVFPPSTQLANHLLKYVSDAGVDGFNAVCQHKLLQCIGLAPELARSYPPCLLEWTANRARAAMALHAVFSDGEKGISQVESWTTAEEFAANTFRSRHIADRITGWNVQLRDDVDTYECAGYDYVIDLISEMELPPSFPCSTAYFLTMTDLSRPASTTGRQHWPEEPHNAERLRLMPLEVDELADQPLASLAPQIHPPRARTPTPPRVYTPSPPPNRPSVVEADEPPSPPPLRKQPPDLIQVNPEEVYIHSEQAISQGSALNRRKDHVPSELSKKSVLNSRYSAKVVVEPEPEPGWDGPARRNNQKPVHQKQAPARQQQPQQKQQQQKQPQQKQHQQQQKQPEPANRSGDDDDMVAWVDDIFKQALGGQPAGHPVQDLGNSQALARNMKGGGDNLPLQLGLGATGTGVYGIAPFGLQPPAAIQPPSAFAQPVMPMMQSPPVLPSLVNPTIPGTLVPNGLPTGLPVSMDPTTIQFMQQQQLLQQQQQQVQQAQQMQHQQQQQQMLQHIRIQQQQQMQIQQHAADLQAQLQVKELEKQVLTSSLQTEMLKQQLEQIQNKKERVTPPTPAADALSKRQSFRDDAPPSQPPRPVSANYSYQAPRPEHHQNHRVEDGVDLYRQGGVNALKRPYLNQNNNFRAAPRHPAAPVVGRHPQLPPASPATRAKAKTKGVKFVDVSDDEDDDDESTSAAPRPRPASPPIQKKEGKKVPVQPASSKNQVWKPAVPAVKAVPEVKAEAPRKPLGSSVVANGQPEPSNARRVPGKIGIKWPPEAEKADARPSVEVNRLVITEVKEVTPTVQRTQSTNDVQQKINSRIRSSQEAAQKNAAAHRKHVPPPAPVKAQPKILTEEAGTQSENWSNVDMATKKKELEKMLKGVQWGTQREKDPPAHPRPPPLHAPPLPAAAAPPPPPSFVPMAASPRDIYESIPDNGLSRLDNIRTALHSQCTGPFFTYRHSDWTLEIKKEVFSPLEKLRNPILVDLVFAQVVGDVLSGDSIRINAEDKRKMKKLLDGHGVNLRNVGSHHSIQVKTAVIRAAKDLPLLFSRLFPVNGGSKYIGLQMVGVSHSGVRLLARNKDVFEDTIVVFETIKFSEIVDVHVPKSSTLLMRLKGRNVVFYTKYATHMRDMLSTYRKEDSEIILQTRMADTDED